MDLIIHKFDFTSTPHLGLLIQKLISTLTDWALKSLSGRWRLAGLKLPNLKRTEPQIFSSCQLIKKNQISRVFSLFLSLYFFSLASYSKPNSFLFYFVLIFLFSFFVVLISLFLLSRSIPVVMLSKVLILCLSFTVALVSVKAQTISNCILQCTLTVSYYITDFICLRVYFLVILRDYSRIIIVIII